MNIKQSLVWLYARLPIRETSEDHCSNKYTTHVDSLAHLLQRSEVTHQIPLAKVERKLTYKNHNNGLSKRK